MAIFCWLKISSGPIGRQLTLNGTHNPVSILKKHHRDDGGRADKGERKKSRDSDTEHVKIPFVLSMNSLCSIYVLIVKRYLEHVEETSRNQKGCTLLTLHPVGIFPFDMWGVDRLPAKADIVRHDAPVFRGASRRDSRVRPD